MITKQIVKKTIMITLSALLSALSISVFVESGALFPGGLSGIAMLIVRIFAEHFSININFAILYFALQIVPTVIVYKYVGKQFTVFSVLHYTLVSIFAFFMPTITIIEDILLISVFGGMLSGLAASIALRNDASGGGTDFVAIYFANKYNTPTWNYIMILNACILVVAGILFGWNVALYSIIFQFCYMQVVNARHDRYKLSTLMMITSKPEEVRNSIFSVCRHGITMVDGEGGYSGVSNKVMFMTVNTYELSSVIKAAQDADDRIFINVYKTERIVGNYRQKPLD